MKLSLARFGGLGLIVAGCGSAPRPVATQPVPSRPPPPVRIVEVASAPVVAILEPYLVPATSTPIAPPPGLRGHIFAPLPSVPLTPLPPIAGTPTLPPPTLPKTPTPPPASPPRRVTILPPAVVKLFEDERAHGVEDARRRLAAAATRATQTAAEAKRLWGFVKSGFVAQRQAENADAAAKDALDEQNGAQKALDDAQQRQRNARRDIEAALRVATVPSPFALAQMTTVPRSYQPVPGLYRLSLVGSGPTAIVVQNGVLGRRLPSDGGEAGAWLVRCADPARLRVGVGARPATVVVRTLPESEAKPKV